MTKKSELEIHIKKKGSLELDKDSMHRLETWADICRIVNKNNIDNFLSDFEITLRLIVEGTENVDKSKIDFPALLWKEDE